MGLDVGLDNVDNRSIGALRRIAQPLAEIVLVCQEEPDHHAPLKLRNGYQRIVPSESLQFLGERENILTDEGHDSRVEMIRVKPQLRIAVIAEDCFQQALQRSRIDPDN